jgi:regulator of sirC expression with transglutaminase-like and TPR domain
MLQNLLSVSRNDPPALHRYLNAMLAIDATHGPYHLLRAMVRYQLDERDGAREDVVWLLEHEPAGVNLSQVRALEAELNRE